MAREAVAAPDSRYRLLHLVTSWYKVGGAIDPLVRRYEVTSSTVTVAVHDTPQEIWDALSRVFKPVTHGTATWLVLDTDGVTVIFYAPRDDNYAEPESIDLNEGFITPVQP